VDQALRAAHRAFWRFAERDQVVVCVLAAVLVVAVAARSGAARWAASRPVRRVEGCEEIGYRVDLNRASPGELDLLPGIGPAKAQRIVDHRRAHGPFERIGDLARVPGISGQCAERLRALVTVGCAASGEERPE
jgi:competence ComEA-like helix-hairpin-helix protein